METPLPSSRGGGPAGVASCTWRAYEAHAVHMARCATRHRDPSHIPVGNSALDPSWSQGQATPSHYRSPSVDPSASLSENLGEHQQS